jgi:hypothetical protein
VKSDPRSADTDGDGISDLEELQRGLDPSSADTDADGLLDGKNVTLVPDSPQAIAWRALHVLEGPRGTFWGERDQCLDLGGLDAATWSSDKPIADKLGDGEELAGWNVTLRGNVTHVTSDPCQPDADRDGLADDLEKTLGTDPRIPDTDSDGARDGIDVDPLHDVGILLRVASYSGGAPTDRLTVTVGALSESHRVDDANASFALNVADTSVSRTSDPTSVLMFVTDGADAPRHVFGANASSLVLIVDLATGLATTLDGANASSPLSASGPDGAITLDWSVTRA